MSWSILGVDQGRRRHPARRRDPQPDLSHHHPTDERAGPRSADQAGFPGALKAGAAVVTGSGDLAAPFVLHVVIRDPDRPDRTGRSAQGPGVRMAACSRLGTRHDCNPAGGRRIRAAERRGSSDPASRDIPLPAGQGFPSELTIVVDEDAERVLVKAILRRTV